MFMTEASTPFVNQRWFLSQRHRHQKRYKATGLAMTIAFFLARPIGMPVFMWWLLSQPQLTAPENIAPDMLASVWLYAGTFCAALYALNVYWSLLLAQGLVRALQAPTSPSNSTHAEMDKHVLRNNSHVGGQLNGVSSSIYKHK
jgi:TLC domain